MTENLYYTIYERQLKQPFRYGDREISSRCGVLLKKDTEGGTAFAEAAPLPGHSEDNLPETIALLRRRRPQELIAEAGSLPASLRFALESFSIKAVTSAAPVQSNALLAWGDYQKMVLRLEQIQQDGYRVCKIKMPPSGWDALAELMGSFPGIQFRLDANQAFSPQGLERLYKLIDSHGLSGSVDYIEEPFPTFWQEASFLNYPLSTAADESASTPDKIEALLSARNSPRVFILKPTVLGGFGVLEKTRALLHHEGRRPIVTSALESEVGRRAIIAHLLQAEREVCGLSTGWLFAENFLKDQASWSCAPAIENIERTFLDRLTWQECGR